MNDDSERLPLAMHVQRSIALILTHVPTGILYGGFSDLTYTKQAKP